MVSVVVVSILGVIPSPLAFAFGRRCYGIWTSVEGWKGKDRGLTLWLWGSFDDTGQISEGRSSDLSNLGSGLSSSTSVYTRRR